jgi:hypothetical protein
MKGRRGGASLLGAAVVATVALLSAPASAAPHCSGVTVDGAWTQLVSPQFTAGPPTATTFAVNGAGTVFVTNGALVLRSSDLGCTWRQVYAADTTNGDVITSIVVPRTTASQEVYLGLSVAANGVASAITSAAVAVSLDDGGRWQQGDALPGDLTALTASRGGVLYALARRHLVSADLGTSVESQATQVVARSDDRGATWSFPQVAGPSVRTPSSSAETGGKTFSGVVADPVDAERIWLYGPDGLSTSRDGGKTVLQVPGAISTQPLATMDVSTSIAKRSQLAISMAGRPIVAYTQRDATSPDTLSFLGIAGQPLSLAAGPRSTEFAVATKDAVTLHPVSASVSAPYLDVTPARARLTELRTIATTTEFVVYGRAGNVLERRVMPTGPRTFSVAKTARGKKARPDQSATLTLDLAKLAKGTAQISPDHMHIGMPVGQKRTVPYTLDLPGSRKVDVYFLIDISDSMADKIKGLKLALDDIVTQLHKAGIDAWFGVGEYRSYAEGPAYARVQDIAPPGPDLLRSLSSLNANGGGNETHLAALFQTATGVGQPDPTAFVAAGQQAHFREDALRLVINATDEGFNTGPPQPSYDEVGAALRSVHALQLGIAYEAPSLEQQLLSGYNPTYTPGPSTGQSIVATATGGLAPAEGADCNGDGAADVLPRAPLVCIVDPANAAQASAIAPAIVNMVLAAPDVQPVSVTWTAEHPIITSITPKVAPAVNLRFPARLTFQVTYSCPATLPAGVYTANLTARVHNAPVTRAVAYLDCQSPQLVTAAGPGFALAVGTAPAPPTEPVSNAQPQGQPQTQPQSQPQAQAQPGAAYQEQENAQLAFAYTNPAQEVGRELSFSRYQPRPAPDDGPPVPMVAAVLVMSTAAGLGLSRARRRSQIALVSVRRSRHR